MAAVAAILDFRSTQKTTTLGQTKVLIIPVKFHENLLSGSEEEV